MSTTINFNKPPKTNCIPITYLRTYSIVLIKSIKRKFQRSIDVKKITVYTKIKVGMLINILVQKSDCVINAFWLLY